MDNELNIKETLMIIRRRLWIVILITLICTTLGYVYKSVNTPTPVYQSSARVIIDANAEYKRTLMVIVRDSTILDKVIQEMELPMTSEQLANQVRVESVENTQVVRISVIDTDPVLAASIANTISSVYQREIRQLVNFYGVTLLSEAKVDTNQVNTPSNRILYITFIFGLVVSIGFVFLLHALDDRVRDEDEMEELLNLPVLGVVSKINKKTLKSETYRLADIEPRGESIEVN